MEKIDVLTLSSGNKDEFIKKLILGLIEYFDTDVDTLPENYGYKHPWSLLSLIRDNAIDTYALVYVNDRIWGGSGGIVRYIDDKKIYQGGFRWFSNAEKIVKGLGCMKAHIHKYTMTEQFERAKQQNCEEYILSFNNYNKRLFDISRKYHLKKAFPNTVFVPSEGMVMFNGVEQYLLTVDLK
jgi:hypothetical protein